MPKKKTASKNNKPNNSVPQEDQECYDLIHAIKNSKDDTHVNICFNRVLDRIQPKISQIVNRFNIPGLDKSDILQESLYALRYKAIKDFDVERSTGLGWKSFESFACLCIRRHLSTEYKSTFQNKRKALNSSLSIDQDHSSGEDSGSIFLSSILPSGSEDIVDDLVKREYYGYLISKLSSALSDFEKEVFRLYALRLSYQEITDEINKYRLPNDEINVKGVDNALSRIKSKAMFILEEYEKEHGSFYDD